MSLILAVPGLSQADTTKKAAKVAAKKTATTKQAKKTATTKQVKKVVAVKAAKKPAAKQTAVKKPVVVYPNVTFDYTPKEITTLCSAALARANRSLEALLAYGKKTKTPGFHYTFVPFETAIAEFDEAIGTPYLLRYTSPNKAVRKAGAFCIRSYFGFSSKLFARRDIYALLKKAAANSKGLDAIDQRLITETLKKFEKNGAGLSEKYSKEVAQLNAKLSQLGMKFRGNIGEDKTVLTFTAKELEGVPAGTLKTLKKDKKGNYLMRPIVAGQYISVLRNAKNPETRKKMLLARQSIKGKENTALLEKIIALRHQLAQKLDYPTYAHYVLTERMAKNPKTVKNFLQQLRVKLTSKLDAEAKIFLALKKKEHPKATALDPWDWRYYNNMMKKTMYAVDGEKIREYFPMNHVIKTVFDIYQTLLGVTFKEIKPANAWHKDVRLFSITDNKSKKIVSYFYLDLFPRPGKYSHFAAFGFQGGRRLMNGTYRQPVSAVVGNWQKPAKGSDALLSHYEVQTFFHEFGHIMHQTLTTARYSSMAGTSVKRDFVEAPSQMLENWVWKPSILKKLTKHYKTGKSLPTKMLNSLIRAKYADAGHFWTRQLFFATVDMTYHTSGPKVDTVKVWQEVAKKVMPVTLTKGTYPAATFGHLVGYAAGYYGYLWSKVYAQDMFTLFEKEGLLSPKAGMQYRNWILERGSTLAPSALLKGFLGRKPNMKAFYKELGLK
tara:strand:- start:7993 stop:10155 length:2163 start_codon:yes stop_codon:yes gene_type:complete